ncbi:MAG: hypothetical protein ACI4O7_09175 [Aristaeellaceae bacterium]
MGVLARRKHRGVLSLTERELIFRHGLRTDIIPYDLSGISVSEQHTALPGHITKQKATVIRSRPEAGPCFYVLRDGAADEINQQLACMRAAADAHAQLQAQLTAEENAAFLQQRESARIHRQLIRQRTRQRCMARKARGTEQPTPDRQPDTLPPSVEQRPYGAPPLPTVQAATEMQQSILQLVACLEARCDVLAMEHVLQDHWFFPEEAAVIAPLLLQAKTRKRPRAFLHTQLCQAFGPEKGPRYYTEITSFLHL